MKNTELIRALIHQAVEAERELIARAIEDATTCKCADKQFCPQRHFAKKAARIARAGSSR